MLQWCAVTFIKTQAETIYFQTHTQKKNLSKKKSVL